MCLLRKRFRRRAVRAGIRETLWRRGFLRRIFRHRRKIDSMGLKPAENLADMTGSSRVWANQMGFSWNVQGKYMSDRCAAASSPIHAQPRQLWPRRPSLRAYHHTANCCCPCISRRINSERWAQCPREGHLGANSQPEDQAGPFAGRHPDPWNCRIQHAADCASHRK